MPVGRPGPRRASHSDVSSTPWHWQVEIQRGRRALDTDDHMVSDSQAQPAAATPTHISLSRDDGVQVEWSR